MNDYSRHHSESSGRMLTARAALLAGAFFLLASAAHAGPITCSDGVDTEFPDYAVRCETFSADFSTTDTARTYTFDGGLFTNTLSFTSVLEDMTIWMSAFFVAPADPVFLQRMPTSYLPELFLTSDGPRWIYFRVEDLQDPAESGTPQAGVHYDGPWRQDIVWFGDGEYFQPEVLHDNRPLDSFRDVITIAGTFNTEVHPEFCVECVCRECESSGFTDPTIGGGASDFSDTIVVSTVPEPASLLLLGSGLGGLLYRRRRQRSAAEPTESA